MNAEKQTQVKSPTMQLIDHCQKQNELIFATRKRLFKLEHNFRLTILAVAVVGSIIVLTLLGLSMVNGEKFEISYYAKKHSKFISRRGQWNEKCKYWFSKTSKPLITYFDIDANNYRTASGSYWIKRGNDE